jgi:predicted N-acetyltransferase YhbS/RimJ/RimL family protein N-acetyltransferase
MEADLETERLRIRRLELRDVESCHRLYLDIGWADTTLSDSENRALRQSLVEWSVQNYIQLARLRQPPYGDRAVVGKDDGTFIGLAGLVPAIVPLGQLPSFGAHERARMAPEVGLFWAISPAWQGRGYATEAGRALLAYAFETLGLERVIATTNRQNGASIGVMRRLGMRIEENPFPEPRWFRTCGVAVWSDRLAGFRSEKVNVLVRPETTADEATIREVTRRAFEGRSYSGGNEQDLVDALRTAEALSISLVAEHEGRILGHAAFSPANLEDGTAGWYALGPVSVEPAVQRRGIGQALITEGITRLRRLGALGCILIGDTRYYSRFGFVNAPQLAAPGEPAEHFMVLCFGTTTPNGVISFHRAFHQEG